MQTNSVLSDLHIYKNKFIDNTANVTGRRQSAIAIIFVNDQINSYPALLINCNIEKNHTNYNQGIYITTVLDDDNALPMPGITCLNTSINNNICGVIGFITTSADNLSSSFTNQNISLGLNITGNTCHYIASLYSTAQHINSVGTPPYAYSFGNVIIDKNYCNWIHVISEDYIASSEKSNLIIDKNILNAYDSTFLSDYLNNNITLNYAILYSSYGNSPDITTALITNNIITYNDYSSTNYSYKSGIWAQGSATITGNIIKGFEWTGGNPSTDGVGIILRRGAVGLATRTYLVTNNKIYRESRVINAYIASINNTSVDAIITDNYLDSNNTDGTTATILNVISPVSPSSLVERNINQTVITKIPGWVGSLTLETESIKDNNNTSKIVIKIGGNTGPTDRTVVFEFRDASVINSGAWIVDLNLIIPNNALVTSVSTNVYPNATPTTSGAMSLTINDDIHSAQTVTGTVTSGVDQALLLTTTALYRNVKNRKCYIKLDLAATTTNPIDFFVSELIVTYRW